MGIGPSVPHPCDIPFPDRRAVLDMNTTIKGIANCIRSCNDQSVVVLAGAGLSVAAGIPDFRTPGTGLYDNLQRFHLPRPESVFDIEFFEENPQPFYELSRELYPGKVLPTKAHFFIRLLAEKNKLRRLITQNIDCLDRLAGVPDDKMIEAHGSFATATCRGCGKCYNQDWVASKIFDEATIPVCPECGGIVKPDITFFGESLPARYGRLHGQDAKAAELLIVMGTSLEVQPVASFPAQVDKLCPRLLINREAVFVEDPPPLEASMALPESQGGFRFNLEDNYRDVFFQGDCDDGCDALAAELGWTEDFERLVAAERARLEEEFASTKDVWAAARPLMSAPEAVDSPPVEADAAADGGGAAGEAKADSGGEDDGHVPEVTDATQYSDVSEHLGGATTAESQARGVAAVRAAGIDVLADAEEAVGKPSV